MIRVPFLARQIELAFFQKTVEILCGKDLIKILGGAEAQGSSRSNIEMPIGSARNEGITLRRRSKAKAPGTRFEGIHE
jgi:hypothetical protein